MDVVSRFPKLQECAHFHYDRVELGKIEVSSSKKLEGQLCLFTWRNGSQLLILLLRGASSCYSIGIIKIIHLFMHVTPSILLL